MTGGVQSERTVWAAHRHGTEAAHGMLDARAFLTTFGVVCRRQAGSNMDTMRIGTPEYMGPELISSK